VQHTPAQQFWPIGGGPVWQQAKPLALRQGVALLQTSACVLVIVGVPWQDVQSSQALVHDSKAAWFCRLNRGEQMLLQDVPPGFGAAQLFGRPRASSPPPKLPPSSSCRLLRRVSPRATALVHSSKGLWMALAFSGGVFMACPRGGSFWPLPLRFETGNQGYPGLLW
jgi:hypothetical protein